jgi:hypothetical protein
MADEISVNSAPRGRRKSGHAIERQLESNNKRRASRPVRCRRVVPPKYHERIPPANQPTIEFCMDILTRAVAAITISASRRRQRRLVSGPLNFKRRTSRKEVDLSHTRQGRPVRQRRQPAERHRNTLACRSSTKAQHTGSTLVCRPTTPYAGACTNEEIAKFCRASTR